MSSPEMIHTFVGGAYKANNYFNYSLGILITLKGVTKFVRNLSADDQSLADLPIATINACSEAIGDAVDASAHVVQSYVTPDSSTPYIVFATILDVLRLIQINEWEKNELSLGVPPELSNFDKFLHFKDVLGFNMGILGPRAVEYVKNRWRWIRPDSLKND